MNKLENMWHDEETLFKVAQALRITGLTEEKISEAIANMLNAGIYFREAPR